VGSEKIGVENPLDPGSHVVVVAAPGRERRSTIVVVAEGARGFVVQGELGAVEPAAHLAPSGGTTPASAAAPYTADAVPLDSGARSTLAYVAGGAGIAGIAASALSTVVLLGKKSSIADHCDPTKACDDTGLGATGGISTWSAIGTIGFGAGVLGIAGFFLLPRESPRAAPALAISPAVGPAFAGARLVGRW